MPNRLSAELLSSPGAMVGSTDNLGAAWFTLSLCSYLPWL